MSNLKRFEAIARRAYRHSDAGPTVEVTAHPFEVRNIHPDVPSDVRVLFDNGHYAQATFEALKYLDEEVQRLSGGSDFGFSLMMRVFGGTPPPLPLNKGSSVSEKNEQDGYKFIFAGVMQGIRNPRGHTAAVRDDPDHCLECLTIASHLLRKLEAAGLR